MHPAAEAGPSHIFGGRRILGIEWESCMSIIKGTVEVTLNLSKSTCYFLRTGKCSLSVVRDFAMSAPGKISKNDLLYCPRLYQSMKNPKR